MPAILDTVRLTRGLQPPATSAASFGSASTMRA